MQRHGRSSISGGTAAVVAALILGACAQEADFGRHRPNLIDRLEAAVLADPDAPASLPLTGAERDLRDVAANLAAERAAPDLDGLSGLARWASALGTEDVSASLRYYRRLRTRHPASSASLLNALADDIEADVVDMERFATLAGDVTAADRARADGLLGRGAAASAVSYDGPGAFAAARGRVGENGRIVHDTSNVLASRLVGYRTALAHARLDAPVPELLAVAEGAIRDMEARMAMVDEIAVRHQAVTASLAGGLI